MTSGADVPNVLCEGRGCSCCAHSIPCPLAVLSRLSWSPWSILSQPGTFTVSIGILCLSWDLSVLDLTLIPDGPTSFWRERFCPVCHSWWLMSRHQYFITVCAIAWCCQCLCDWIDVWSFELMLQDCLQICQGLAEAQGQVPGPRLLYHRKQGQQQAASRCTFLLEIWACLPHKRQT